MSDRGNSSSRGSPPSSSSKPRASPFSSFPFGSPLQQGKEQTSFCGSPGQRLLLNSFPGSSHNRTAEVVTPRLKGQDLYGGPVMFGGSSSSFRRHRMLAASPYSAGLRSRQAERAARSSLSLGLSQAPLGCGGGAPGAPPAPPSSLPSTASSSPSPLPANDSMSSTARLILDTLDKMSTPIQDAKKMPVLVQPRAEKRKLIQEELNCSLKSPQRRRVRLGPGSLSLGGPPLRRNYGAVPLTNGVSAPPSPLPRAPSVPNSVIPTPAASMAIATPSIAETTQAGALRGSHNLATTPVFPLAMPIPVAGSSDQTEELWEKNNNKKKRSLEDDSQGPNDSSSSRKKPASPVKQGQNECESSRGLNDCASSRGRDDWPTSRHNLISTPADKGSNEEKKCLVSTPQTMFSFAPTTSSPAQSLIPSLNATSATSKPSSSPLKTMRSSQPSTAPSQSSTTTCAPPSSTPLVSNKSIPSFSSCSTTTGAEAASAAPSSSVASMMSNSCLSQASSSPTGSTPAVQTFSFALPTMMSTQECASLKCAVSKTYTFNVPPSALSTQNCCLPSAGVPHRTPRTVSTQGDRRLVTTPNIMFSAMPDVTNNLVKRALAKDNCKDGRGSLLPDLTASTGFGGLGPASTLKTGSVMDILGKKS